VTSLTDPDGNITNYTDIDQSGVTSPSACPTASVLNKVIRPAISAGTPTLTYTYNDPIPCNRFALTGVVDENGNNYAAWTYEHIQSPPSSCALGRALSSTLANGADQTTISYNDTTNARTVTNALSKQFSYNMNTATSNGLLQVGSVAGQQSTNTAASTILYAYDSSTGYVSSITDGNGNINTYTYSSSGNSVGLETSRTEGSGTSVARTITTTWDANWREPDVIVAPNLTTNFTYDGSSGLLVTLAKTDTSGTSGRNCVTGTTSACTWTYTYYTTPGKVGLLNTATDSLGGTTTYSYSISPPGSTTPPAGITYLSSITDPLQHTTNITASNGRGQPLTSVDPNNVTTIYTYDPQGRILTITVSPGPGQALTTFTYDLAGNITQIGLPDGSTLVYAYDQAHRLTSITNNLGESITYTLDALGDRTARVVKSAIGSITKQQSATFDELGRVMANIGAASQTTTYSYDRNNNEISTRDPRGYLYGHAFDALNRLYQQTDPDNYTTTTTYNPQDAVTGVSAVTSLTSPPTLLTTTYVRDGFGDVVSQTSPDTGTATFSYDVNGAMIKQVDARSIETDYTNDLIGRVLTKTFPAAPIENVTYAYDSSAGGNNGIGHLASVSDQSGKVGFFYDALGHVTSETRVTGGIPYVTAYTYDPAGNILTETYPSSRIVTYTRDALGRISGIATQQNASAAAVTVASSIAYEPFGPLAGLSFGNGVIAGYGYDQDYQLTLIKAAAAGGTPVQNVINIYDAAGNITNINDNLVSARTQMIAYDHLNRIASASGAYGSQGYTYDGVGNRLTRVTGATTETYAYNSISSTQATNQIHTVTAAGNTRTFFYQSSGQVSEDKRDPSHDYTFAANDNGRNASAALNGSPAGAYLYNAFEQRVQKTVGSATTQFVFDRFGHLLQEANGGGAAQKEYIWLDDTPVAVVDDTGASPAPYYIHTDQIGTPQKITDANGVVVWDGVFDPFGNALSFSGGVWDTSHWDNFLWGGSLALTNLRFPGQYADAETALNQNWFRDYDSTIGRYIQSDPIGLLGGTNTYAYVGANPIIYGDLYGLCNEECKRTIVRARRKAQLLLQELAKYNPITDPIGGFGMPFGRGITVPGGHAIEIDQLQRGIKNDLSFYAKNCLCDNQGGSDTDDCPPYPKWIDELANRPIPTAPPSSSTIHSMTPAQAATAAGATAALIATLLILAF
jgi:RHS repeat-associated protein